MKKILLLILSLFFISNINANKINWNQLEENFDSKLTLPSEFREKLEYISESNFYLYCYNDTSYILNTNKKENLRFIVPIIGKFKNSNDSFYNEYLNCNIRAKNINITILDNEKDILCINDISYKHTIEGLIPLFEYKRYLKTKVGNPLSCKNYKPNNKTYSKLIDSGAYCINDFVYFKKNDIKNVLPLYSELQLRITQEKNKFYKFNYDNKQHPLFCRGGSMDDYSKSKSLMISEKLNDYYIEHGKKYKILIINKQKFLIPIIETKKLPFDYNRPEYIKIPAGLN